MTPDEKKIVTRAIRIETIIYVSLCTEARIEAINQSDSEIRNCFLEIWDNAQRRLRREGHAALLERERLGNFNPDAAIRSMIGNLPNAYEDLKEGVPSAANLQKLHLWNNIWRLEKAKTKRADLADKASLSKKVKRQQDAAAVPGGREDISGAETSMRTAYNSVVAHILAIPHEALILESRIGGGAFGDCRRVRVKGISFLPEHITYCAKCYKGDDSMQHENFVTEHGMQILHPSIVRCIAFTSVAPWTNIFPFYNGESLGDMMCKVPFVHGEFRRTIHRLKEGWKSAPAPDHQLSEVQHAQIRACVMNMPHIMHAIVAGMNAAHMAGILHTDLHPFNVMLDFTRDMHVRVGIIDWGLLLRVGKKRRSMTFVFDADMNAEAVAEKVIWGQREQRARPWLAPELLDPLNENAYTRASDIYAVGYLLQHLYNFWKVAQRIWMQNSIIVPPDVDLMERIKFEVQHGMLIESAELRKPLPEILEFFRSLKTDPAIVQRPLLELGPAFYST